MKIETIDKIERGIYDALMLPGQGIKYIGIGYQMIGVAAGLVLTLPLRAMKKHEENKKNKSQDK